MVAAHFSKEVAGEVLDIESAVPSESSPMRWMLYVPRLTRIVHRIFFGTDPAITKTCQMSYGAIYLRALAKEDIADRNTIARMDEHCYHTVESYFVDREESRKFSIEELVRELDIQIDLIQKIASHPDVYSVSARFSLLGETLARKFIYHVFARVVYYALRYPMIPEGGNDRCYFDSADLMHVCSTDRYNQDYMYRRGSHKEALHVLQVLKRKLEKDCIIREKNPHAVLDHFTRHEGLEQISTARKIQSFFAIVGIVLISSAICGDVFLSDYGFCKYLRGF